MEPALKSYKKELEYSYALGAFPTFELLRARPESALAVLVSSAYREEDAPGGGLLELCRKQNIPVEQNDKVFRRLSPKENCFVIGVFRKYACALDSARPHVALVNPGNMGNLGTIVRTMLGFGVKDLAVLEGGVDLFDPKAVRASMGALFRIRFARFQSVGEYLAAFPGRAAYPFMLDGARELDALPPCAGPYTLIFGNEATGLGPEYQSVGQSVVIPCSEEIDSLNLSIAVGIALYAFSGRAGK